MFSRDSIKQIITTLKIYANLHFYKAVAKENKFFEAR